MCIVIVRYESGLSRWMANRRRYSQNRNNSNEPGRPIAITFYNSTNLYVEGIKFIQPQFWATFVTYSHNVTMRVRNPEWVSNGCCGPKLTLK